MTSYFAGKSKVSPVTVIFGNGELDMTVGYVYCGTEPV
jgi:hypothetical protein